MNDPWIFQSLEVHFVLYLYVLIMISHDTSACFFSFIKLISLQNAHMSFSKDGYGLDVGGGCGSGPVFLISVLSYHYMIFISMSVSTACINVLGSPEGQAICLGAQVHMPPMNLFALVCMCVRVYGVSV
jgi:hypothetical protein